MFPFAIMGWRFSRMLLQVHDPCDDEVVDSVVSSLLLLLFVPSSSPEAISNESSAIVVDVTLNLPSYPLTSMPMMMMVMMGNTSVMRDERVVGIGKLCAAGTAGEPQLNSHLVLAVSLSHCGRDRIVSDE